MATLRRLPHANLLSGGVVQDTPRRVDGLAGRKVASVAVGEFHMLVLLQDGAVWSFGKVHVTAGTPKPQACPWSGFALL